MPSTRADALRGDSTPLLSTSLSDRWRATAPPAWLEHWRVERFAVEGGALEGVDAGSGPPLVLLPPLPGWKEAFVALLPLLAGRFRVITFDLRSRFPGAPSWEALAEDCEAVAAARIGGPVAVLGHSFGGALAIAWAARHPQRVRALVVSSGFAHVTTPRGAWASRYLEQPLALAAMRLLPEGASAGLAAALARRRRWVFDARCDRPVVELVRAGIRGVPLRLVRQRVRLALGLDLRGRLGELRCPVLVLRGEHDTPFVREAADDLARRVPGSATAIVPGGGHLHPLSSAGALAGLAGDWVLRTSRAAAQGIDAGAR